jgi:hypothetical protein
LDLADECFGVILDKFTSMNNHKIFCSEKIFLQEKRVALGGHLSRCGWFDWRARQWLRPVNKTANNPKFFKNKGQSIVWQYDTVVGWFMQQNFTGIV